MLTLACGDVMVSGCIGVLAGVRLTTAAIDVSTGQGNRCCVTAGTIQEDDSFGFTIVSLSLAMD